MARPSNCYCWCWIRTTNKGLVEITETVTTEVKLGTFRANLPCLKAYLKQDWRNWFTSTTEPSMANLQQSFERHEAGPGIGLLKKLGITMDGGSFVCANESLVDEIEYLQGKIFSLNFPKQLVI